MMFPLECSMVQVWIQAGRGDMSRGALLLRAARAEVELAYVPVAGAVRRGSRPRKAEASDGDDRAKSTRASSSDPD